MIKKSFRNKDEITSPSRRTDLFRPRSLVQEESFSKIYLFFTNFLNGVL